MRRCTLVICMLKQKSQKQNIKSGSHGSAVASEGKPSWIFIWSSRRRKERAEGGRQRLRERLSFMCFSGGGGHQDRTDLRMELQHGPYGCYSQHPLFLKQSISLNVFGLTGLGHTHSPSFFYCMIWLVCVSWLRFCHRTFRLISHYDRQIYVLRALQQLFISCHSSRVRAAVVFLIECEINLAHTLSLFSAN